MAEKNGDRTGGIANLKYDFTREEREEMGRKGGIKSGESKRRKKLFKETIDIVLACGVQDEEVADRLKALGLDNDYQTAMHLALIEKAARGDTEAARYLRDTRGEKPRDGLELGNLDDKPLASLDMSKMTDEQLRILAARRAEIDSEEE
jgi:hypothetical protein